VCVCLYCFNDKLIRNFVRSNLIITARTLSPTQNLFDKSFINSLATLCVCVCVCVYVCGMRVCVCMCVRRQQ